MKSNNIKKILVLSSLISMLMVSSCKDDESPVAPYTNETELENILIEQNSYTPKVTWLGGYVNVFAVNEGTNAMLDNSLVWLVSTQGDNITYPALYGTIKENEQNITESYGGSILPELLEDNIYTFWIAKENIWNILTNNTQKIILIDSTLSDLGSAIIDDTLFVSQTSYSSLTYSLDVFINVDESSIQNRGRLGTVYIEQANTSNNLNITWDFQDSEAADLRISAMGICEGQQFDINNQTWDLYSVEEVNGENIYGSKNIISQPIKLGEEVEGTRVFYEFPENGLERNKNYYLWIATSDWDGENRGRTADGYATITFKTW